MNINANINILIHITINMDATIHISTNMIVAATITTILIVICTLCPHHMYANMKYIYMNDCFWSLVLHLHPTFWLSYFIALVCFMRHESCGPIYFQSKDMHAFVCFMSNQLQSNLILIVCKHAITHLPIKWNLHSLVFLSPPPDKRPPSGTVA